MQYIYSTILLSINVNDLLSRYLATIGDDSNVLKLWEVMLFYLLSCWRVLYC